MAVAAGAETVFNRLRVPEVEIRRRWRANAITRERFHWPEAEFESLLATFEELGSDEPTLVLNADDDLDRWITENIAPRHQPTVTPEDSPRF